VREIGNVAAVEDVEDAVGEDQRAGKLCQTPVELRGRTELGFEGRRVGQAALP
jgi:hypothetical protein